MTRIKKLTAALALAVSAAGTSHAGVLATAPALAAYPTTQTMYCDIVSLQNAPKNVTIDMLDYFGNVITTATFSLLPNQGNALGDATGQAAWCRFTVDGSAKKYRAVAVYDNGSAYTIGLPAN